MGVVDTIMVGGLGPTAISAVSIGVALHMGFVVFGMGLLLGVDMLVSRAFGARDLVECQRWLFHGVALALMMTVPIMLMCGALFVAIPALGFHPLVTPYVRGYFGALLWSTPLLLLFAAFRRYLQGIHTVAPVMFALVSSNLLNAFFNWVLINGHLGAPAMGVVGSAWATVISRAYLAGVLALSIWWYDRARGSGLRQAPRTIEVARLGRLIQLGLPAASQISAEVGVFVLATAMAGRLDPIASASHQIALNLVGVAYMVPLGISSAGAVRVGHAIGAHDPGRAAASGWTAILIGALAMAAPGALFFAVPRQMIALFSTDAAVLEIGSALLGIGAIFLLFDSLQSVATGALRGLGDTRTPMVVNLVAHWLVGLPVGYALCFIFGWGVIGLWIGLSLGLIVTGIILVQVWNMKIREYLTAAARLPDLRPARP